MKKINIKVNVPYILNDSTQFCIVESGQIKVFYTTIDFQGNYTSRLRFLYTVDADELIFSLHTQDSTSLVRLVLVSNHGTLLIKDKTELKNQDQTIIEQGITKWLTKNLNYCFHYSFSKKDYKPVTLGINHLKSNEIAYTLNDDVYWTKLIEGGLNCLAGNIEINPKEEIYLPVSNKLWLQSLEENAVFEVVQFSHVFHSSLFNVTINRIAALFNQCLENKIVETTNSENNYLQNSASVNKKALNRSFKLINDVISKDEDSETSLDFKSDDLLINTLHLIGEKSGFMITCPKEESLDHYSIANKLNLLAKYSRVRVRKVMLRGEWWKEDCGNLLGFLKDSNLPVAIIQNGSNTYIMNNLLTNEKSVVNYKVVAELDVTAYMIFPGFKSEIKNIKEVLNFAFNGLHNSLKFLILASLAGSILGLLLPILTRLMYDDVIPTADKGIHFQLFSLLLVIGFLISSLQIIQGILQLRIESKSNINLQAGVMDHLLKLPVNFFKKFSAGDLTNRVLSINSIRQIISSTLISALSSGFFSFINLLLLFYYDAKLAWIGVLLGVIAMLYISIIGYFKIKLDREVSEYQGDIQGFLFEFITGIIKIRITSGESRIFYLWANKFSKLKKASFKASSYQNLVEIFNSSYPLFTSIVFFSFLYYQINNEAIDLLSVGVFIAFITAFNKFLTDSLNLSISVVISTNMIPLYERVKPILEEKPESNEESLDPGVLMGDIEMNSISFRYNKEQNYVLKNISFKVNVGEYVAFVGTSGAGKSTILRLLLGFESPENGTVFYDGNDLKKVNKELLRKQIGVVLQNGTLMSGSIYQNIIGTSDLKLDDAWEAARLAGMEEDIKSMPMQMHTVVSEGAATFSGGQKQRLMIAKAIVHKPNILFMDEATSALDNKTQNTVTQSLNILQTTRIVIAHRLSTIKNADRIYVLDKGEIVEIGNYNELIKLNGVFTNLVNRQLMQEIDE